MVRTDATDATMTTVHALIEQCASESPDAVYALGLVTGQTLRYGELVASCRRIGALLRSHGLKAGDTVSLGMPNGLPFSLSMGCGTWGKNNFSDNMNYRHYLNITRISRPIPERLPTEREIFGGYFDKFGNT